MGCAFGKTNILLPNSVDFTKWAIIACDQFTSDAKYWERVESIVNNGKSAYNLILPEIYLEKNAQERIGKIVASMDEYITDDTFGELNNAFVYVERTCLCLQPNLNLM